MVYVPVAPVFGNFGLTTSSLVRERRIAGRSLDCAGHGGVIRDPGR